MPLCPLPSWHPPSLGATFYLEAWKRKQVQVATHWGMTGYEQEEQERPEFANMAELNNFSRISPVTGKPEHHFPEAKKTSLLIRSWTIVSTFIVLVGSAIVACFALRAYLSHPAPYGRVYLQYGNDDEQTLALGSIIGSILNAVQIQIMNAIYQSVADSLTEAENHRTETAFEDALISKTFSFQFVNSYMSLIYVAFIKQALAILGGFENRCVPNCMAELSTSLGIIFITNITVGNVTEVIIPYYTSLKKMKEERERAVMRTETDIPPLTNVERQFMKIEYDVLKGTFQDYSEMIIQFGYCTLFVVAYPLSVVLAVVNNYIEIRVDAWKLCQSHRRPYPVSAEDIGTWQSFLELMSTLAVMSNMVT